MNNIILNIVKFFVTSYVAICVVGYSAVTAIKWRIRGERSGWTPEYMKLMCEHEVEEYICRLRRRVVEASNGRIQ